MVGQHSMSILQGLFPVRADSDAATVALGGLIPNPRAMGDSPPVIPAVACALLPWRTPKRFRRSSVSSDGNVC